MEAIQATKPTNFNPHLGDWETFYKEHKAMVFAVVNRFKHRLNYNWELDYEDLVSVGIIGLFKAYLNFDPAYGFTFSTYAFPSIEGELLKFFRDFNPRGVKVPRNIRLAYWKVHHSNYFMMKDEEVSKALDLDEKDVHEARMLERTLNKIVSKDQCVKFLPVKKDEEKLIYDDLISEDQDFTGIFVEEFLNSLPERERTIVKLRMEGKSQEEIGKIVKLSQVQVCRIIKQKIMPKLINYMKGLNIKEINYNSKKHK